LIESAKEMFKSIDNSVVNNGFDSSYDEIVMRSELKPGDMGWIIERNAIVYYEEYGWNVNFEKLVLKIVSEYFTNFDSDYEKFWFAEYQSKNVGFVCLTRESDSVAKSRLLFIEKNFRRRGIGEQLIDKCIEFAKSKNYSKVHLWTNDVLTDAAKLYCKKGFKLIEEEKHCMFGPQLIAQIYELIL